MVYNWLPWDRQRNERAREGERQIRRKREHDREGWSEVWREREKDRWGRYQ